MDGHKHAKAIAEMRNMHSKQYFPQIEKKKVNVFVKKGICSLNSRT